MIRHDHEFVELLNSMKLISHLKERTYTVQERYKVFVRKLTLQDVTVSVSLRTIVVNVKFKVTYIDRRFTIDVMTDETSEEDNSLLKRVKTSSSTIISLISGNNIEMIIRIYQCNKQNYHDDCM